MILIVIMIIEFLLSQKKSCIYLQIQKLYKIRENQIKSMRNVRNNRNFLLSKFEECLFLEKQIATVKFILKIQNSLLFKYFVAF